MKTQELDLFTKIKDRFSEQEARSFMEYFEKTITEKTEEAVRNKTANFVDRKEMSEFLVEIKVAINNLNNSIINLENKFSNSIVNLENKLNNKITTEIKTATIKNLWLLVITVVIIQIITIFIAISMNNHH